MINWDHTLRPSIANFTLSFKSRNGTTTSSKVPVGVCSKFFIQSESLGKLASDQKHQR